MIFLLKRAEDHGDPRPITEVSLGWVFLNEALSSGARLCFPSRSRFSGGRLKLSRTIQRTVSV